MAQQITPPVKMNKEQLEAVNFTSGNLLIIASAGTGKTTTIVERYVHMINNEGFRPEEIMMTTFTNKAAKDMIRKIIERTGREPLFVGTMHSLFLKIIRANAQHLSLDPEFTLIHDDADKKKIVKQILVSESLDSKAESIKYFIRWISRFKNLGILAEKLSENLSVDDNIRKGIIEEAVDDEIVRVDPSLRKFVNKVYKKYEAELKKSNSIDLDDILLLAFKLLDKNPEVRKKYADKFKAIMVDEAQDLNIVQKNILNLLKNGNLCLIGDDCQNIYEWRGSSNELVFDFSENEKTIFLKENYRSGKNIIESVNKVIKSMKFKIDKRLECTKPHKGSVAIESFYDSEEEINFIVSQIKSLLSKKVSKDQIAVLFRTNRIGMEIERELRKNKIPCHLSKSRDFFEREEIKDVISFLRLKVNSLSILDFERVLLLNEGLGKAAAKKFEEISAKKGCSILESMDFAGELKLADYKMLEIKKLKSCLLDFEKNPIELFLNGFGYENILSEKYGYDARRLEDKLENIGVLLELFGGRKSAKEDINRFLDELIELGRKDKSQDKVTLSTIHSAKGLEWQHVFLMSCNERTLPYYRDELANVKRDSELRLFYVALSRAKDSLIISHYAQGDWGRPSERSSFIDIIDF